MRKLLSIGLSLSMLAVCCFGALPASAEQQTHTIHTFTAENATDWVENATQKVTKTFVEGEGLRVDNDVADYGYFQNTASFPNQTVHLTCDGADANVTDYSNVADGIHLYVKNLGPAVDTHVIIQVAMGPQFRSTITIPEGEDVQKIVIPMSSFKVVESSNDTYPVDTTWDAFMQSNPTPKDWFDIFKMGFKALRPAATPAAKPAVRPVAKPAARPVAKPAARPAARPVAKPATRPSNIPKARCTPLTRPITGPLCRVPKSRWRTANL